MKRIFLPLLLLLAAGVFAQDINKARIDSLLTILDNNGRSMGSVAIVKNGRVVYERAIGPERIGAATPMPASPATRYRIGSITKTFTATMVLQQVEAGKLSLDTKLSQFFPQVQKADSITIAHLLQHRSGIFNITDDSTYERWNQQPQTTAALIEKMNAGGSRFSPGSKASYSNSGYILLGLILEKITGKSYAALLEQKIAKPLGLKDTYAFAKPKAGEAASYHVSAGGWTEEPFTDASIPGGAGVIVSTPRDVARFYEGLFTGKLVSAATLETMKTVKDRYGMGLTVIPYYEHKSWGHTGGIDGFRSVAAYFPADSVAVAWTSNGENYPGNSILIGVLSAVFNKPYTMPSFATIKVDAATLASYAGTYSAPGFPLKIEVRVTNGALEAQATGQGSFPLEATAKDVFKFDAANITMAFNTAEKKMTLKQGSKTTEFTKE